MEQTHQAFRGADPKCTLPISQQGANVVALDLWRILFIENSKSYAVEASQTLLSADPDVTIRGLCNGVNGVLRQAILGKPHLMAKLGKFSLRIKGERTPAVSLQQ